MGTRALIGMTTQEQQVRFTLCYLDGYPESLGIILNNHYSDQDEVARLISRGTLSHIHGADEAHTPRAKGPGIPNRSASGIEAFLDTALEQYRDVEWIYLHTNNGWISARTRYCDFPSLRPLAELLPEPQDPPCPEYCRSCRSTP